MVVASYHGDVSLLLISGVGMLDNRMRHGIISPNCFVA
jgi:hypothetical protein